MVLAVLEAPGAHDEELAVGAGVEVLLVGLVGGVLGDALGEEGDEAVAFVHHCPRDGFFTGADAGGDGHYAVLAGFEDFVLQCLYLCLGHGTGALYLHALRHLEEGDVAQEVEGDGLGGGAGSRAVRTLGARLAACALSPGLRVRNDPGLRVGDGGEEAGEGALPAAAALGAALGEEGHGELDAADGVEVLAVVYHLPQAARVIAAVVDHVLQLPFPEEDPVMEACLEDEADLGVLAAVALAGSGCWLGSLCRLLCSLSPGLRARDIAGLGGGSGLGALAFGVLVAEVHDGGGGEAQAYLLVAAVYPALEAVEDVAQGLLLG